MLVSRVRVLDLFFKASEGMELAQRAAEYCKEAVGMCMEHGELLRWPGLGSVLLYDAADRHLIDGDGRARVLGAARVGIVEPDPELHLPLTSAFADLANLDGTLVVVHDTFDAAAAMDGVADLPRLAREIGGRAEGLMMGCPFVPLSTPPEDLAALSARSDLPVTRLRFDRTRATLGVETFCGGERLAFAIPWGGGAPVALANADGDDAPWRAPLDEILDQRTPAGEVGIDLLLDPQHWAHLEVRERTGFPLALAPLLMLEATAAATLDDDLVDVLSDLLEILEDADDSLVVQAVRPLTLGATTGDEDHEGAVRAILRESGSHLLVALADGQPARVDGIGDFRIVHFPAIRATAGSPTLEPDPVWCFAPLREHLPA